MKKLIYFSSFTLIFISAFLFRCSKEKDNGNQEQQISFAISVPETKSGSETKGATGYSVTDAKKLFLQFKTPMVRLLNSLDKTGLDKEPDDRDLY